MTEEKFKKPEIWLSIPLCETIYERFRAQQAKALPESEPIPPVKTRYAGRLESIIGAIQTRSKMQGYDVVTTAVSLYVLLARSQAFFNANKRMSIVISGAFLYLNGLNLLPHPSELGDLTLLVSRDQKTSIDNLITDLTPFFKKLVRPLSAKELKELEVFLAKNNLKTVG